MDWHAIVPSFICIVTILLAGCSTDYPGLPNETTKITPANTTPLSDNQICSTNDHCVLKQQTSLYLTVSPQRYSPLMSSTIGIGIEVNARESDHAPTLFTWNATYGYFLSWGPVDWTVKNLGNPVTNRGEKLYWSFIETPALTHDPVMVTVTATDPATGRVLGNSTITLDWDEDYGIVVRNPR